MPNVPTLLVHNEELKTVKTAVDKTVEGLKSYVEAQIQMVLNNLTASLEMIEAAAVNGKIKKVLSAFGSTYIRWGRTICSDKETDLVYKGYMAGTKWNKSGGGSEYLCLPQNVTWGEHGQSDSQNGKVYGVEYEMRGSVAGRRTYNENAPCCLCKTNRSTTIMIPGRVNCFSGWTLEYTGYLGAGQDGNFATNYVCIDSDPEGVTGGSRSEDEAVVHNVETKCGALPCPPYVNDRQLACVVCSI